MNQAMLRLFLYLLVVCLGTLQASNHLEDREPLKKVGHEHKGISDSYSTCLQDLDMMGIKEVVGVARDLIKGRRYAEALSLVKQYYESNVDPEVRYKLLNFLRDSQFEGAFIEDRREYSKRKALELALNDSAKEKTRIDAVGLYYSFVHPGKELSDEDRRLWDKVIANASLSENMRLAMLVALAGDDMAVSPDRWKALYRLSQGQVMSAVDKVYVVIAKRLAAVHLRAIEAAKSFAREAGGFVDAALKSEVSEDDRIILGLLRQEISKL